MKKLFIFLVALIGLGICASAQNVYVGGESNGNATIWTNGTPQYFSDGIINSVIVINDEVYAAGKDGDEVAKVWKNGTVIHTLEGTYSYIFVNSMAISGDDIYVVTQELSSSWQSFGRLWINGVAQSGYDNASELHSVFIDGNDIYVAGTTGKTAIIWKNGTQLYSYTSEYAGAFPSVIVADGDVYYMGGDYGAFGKNSIKQSTIGNDANGYNTIGKITNDYGVKVWKNDEMLYTLGEEVYGGSLCFSDGVLYAAGQASNANYVPQAKIWIDGVGTVLEEVWGAAESIFVLDGDVYVAGWYGNYPKLAATVWKNGDATTLSSGGFNLTHSIFVVQTTNYYTVTFDGEEIDIEPQIIEEGKLATRPTDPERENYDFSGWYTDNYTFLNEWIFESDIVTQDTTLFAKWTPKSGIEDIEKATIKIYPNPVKEVLLIEKGEFIINRIEIVNLSGIVMYQFNSFNNKINVSALPKGFYFVKIETDNRIITEKFLKE
ncbi:MAG: InlB B-repeat-containing protein [Marinilabiliaceae bacterium]|nr:InlB B-repeat-containing protein [Marinilabiliaceae bacterium]